MNTMNFSEQYGEHPIKGPYRTYRGELEFEIRDVRGRTIEKIKQPNIVKIFAKEILSHRLCYSKVWDPTGGTGSGEWVTHSIDIDESAVKYICFGASFDTNGTPLDQADARYYAYDSITGAYVPVALNSGTDNSSIGNAQTQLLRNGSLINPIPVSEPSRPLKRIERIYFQPSYQPAGSPLVENDGPNVRAINNIVVFETTLEKDEYNGFGTTASDYFTLTEVSLVGAAEIGSIGTCDCDPRMLFLTGSVDGNPIKAIFNDSATISLDPSVLNPDVIKEGDQIQLQSYDSTKNNPDFLGQLNPFYLVVNKQIGGRDITLDRTPTNSDGTILMPNSGNTIGIYRDGFKMFSQRILTTPIKKSSDFVIIVRWSIILN